MLLKYKYLQNEKFCKIILKYLFLQQITLNYGKE